MNHRRPRHRPPTGRWARDALHPAGDPALRASDADRELVVDDLREHCEAGRLDAEELDQRLGAAFTARTLGDLDPLVADLPGHPRSPGAVRQLGGPSAWRLVPALIAALVAVSLVSGQPVIWLAGPVVLFTMLRRSAVGRRHRRAAHARSAGGTSIA